MDGQSFCIYRRKPSPYYYVKFRNPLTGFYAYHKSTGETDKNRAVYLAQKWLIEGVPDERTGKNTSIVKLFEKDALFNKIDTLELTTEDAQKILMILQKKSLINQKEKESLSFIPWLLSMWEYDTSQYVQEKLTFGHQIGRRRCYDATVTINKHWEPHFQGVMLEEVSKRSLKEFSLALKEKGLSPKTINNILAFGTPILGWAAKNDILSHDPTEGLVKFSNATNKRGILEQSEISLLFTEGEWVNHKAKIASMLACYTGLRSGEILALQLRDIGKDRIFVRHSWSKHDGLKCPKNTKERVVPLLPFLRQELMRIARSDHVKLTEEAFIFSRDKDPQKPMDGSTLRKPFVKALISIGISNEERKTRKIDFHSWRHTYSTILAQNVGSHAAKVTGHLDPTMFELYSDHLTEDEFEEIKSAVADKFTLGGFNVA